MNYINGRFIQIPDPVIDQEQIPLSPPPIGHASALQLWAQLPNELKYNGFGYYINQYDDNNNMPDYELYWSYIANYYYYNYNNPICSFYDWQEKVQVKVGGYRVGIESIEFVDFIIDSVDAGHCSFAKGAYDLFTRRQMIYYGW